MLSNTGLDRKFWAEAISTACYLINRGPYTCINLKTPYELWSGKSADYSSLRAFGCTVYYHVNGVKGYRVWSPSKGRVILSRNVVFDENSMFNPILKTSISEDENGAEKQVDQKTEVSCEMEVDVPQSHSKVEVSVVPPSVEHQSLDLDHPRRENYGVPPTRYEYEDMLAFALQVAEEVDPHELASYKEAVTGTESVQWLAVIGDEIKSLQKNQTWELARKPAGRKVVTCK
ncbi:hypothetical protein LIER_30321 [Lithospermum erythrorhizon]|uniref:Retroviral polymerase SH3-like domain-containing protein n=1 Tax=Lithospermum erythrorhizon TaxID=34254 RepID=A0AAV3RPG5_LITER